MSADQTDLCAALRSALGRATPPDRRLLEHAAGCLGCRGLIALVGAADPAGLARALPTRCDSCEPDLAAYLSLELDEGADAAARAYPQVWLHLWSCERCAATLQLMRSLAAAEQTGLLPAPVLHAETVSPRGWRTILTIPPLALQLVLAPPPARLGAARGEGAAPAALGAEIVDGSLVALSAAPAAAGWELRLTSDPPLRGVAALLAGDLRREAAIDAQGCAQFASLPAALLAPDRGVELLVQLGSSES